MSRDELTRPLVSALQVFGLRVPVGIPEALPSGNPSRLLSVVLHLCLTKKLPAWLMRNRRPVIVQPYLRRLETSVMQVRLVTRPELRRAVPWEHFAYRRQLSGQTLALECRWPLAGWAIQHTVVWSKDWDEANAFCNPNHKGAGAWDHKTHEESQSPRLQNFYDGLDVCVTSPYGLPAPYKLRNSGAQGNSQRVGYLSKISEKRIECFRQTAHEGLYPEDPQSGALNLAPGSRGSPRPPTANSWRSPSATTAATCTLIWLMCLCSDVHGGVRLSAGG